MSKHERVSALLLCVDQRLQISDSDGAGVQVGSTIHLVVILVLTLMKWNGPEHVMI